MVECEYCEEEFGSEEERIEHELDEHTDEMTGHEKDDRKSRLSKIKDRKNTSRIERNQTVKKAGIGLGALALIAGIGFAVFQNYDPQPPATNESLGIGTAVHWHAQYDLTVCGEDRILQGGPMLAHTHGEKTFHMEGVRQDREQTTLGWIVDQLGGDFSNTGIEGFEEPESCPNTEEPGNLTVRANGEILEDPESYIVRNGDQIDITYS